MKKASLCLIMLLCFSLLILSGCATVIGKDRQKAPAMLEPQAVVKFSDVPVPMGFKLLAKDSYFFESTGVRVGVLRYQGKASADRVVIFYKEQMPMYNWTLLNIVEYGDRLLNFDRDAESCIIGLSSKGSLTSITISVGPKAQVYKKAEKPLK